MKRSLLAIVFLLISLFTNAQNAEFYLKFDSQILDGKQENQLSILISSDFKGKYDLENINAAKWTDITNRFRLATHADNRVLVPSGDAKISDLIPKDKPFYIAFKYITKPQTTNGRYNLWRIQNLLLQSVVKDTAKIAVMPQSAGAWKLLQSSNYDLKRGYIYLNNITFVGNAPEGAKKDEQTEGWAISKAIR